MLDEWTWSEHFAPQEETERYIRFICDKYDLWKSMQFDTRVKSAHWQSEGGFWKITDQTGREYSARFLITGIGLLSDPTLPNIPGVEEFKGEAFHTSRWPSQKVSFEGKNVGVIGVGATAIQIIPEVAKTAKSLTVFQRTPNWVHIFQLIQCAGLTVLGYPPPQLTHQRGRNENDSGCIPGNTKQDQHKQT